MGQKELLHKRKKSRTKLQEIKLSKNGSTASSPLNSSPLRVDDKSFQPYGQRPSGCSHFEKSKLKEAVISTKWMTTKTLKMKRQTWHKYKCPYKQGSFLKTRKRKSLLKIPYGEENHRGNKFQVQRKIKFEKRNQINLKNPNMAKPQTQSMKASSTLKPLKLPPQCGYSKLFVMNTSYILKSISGKTTTTTKSDSPKVITII
ncbi:hypothetical protein JCGZ_01930 [Jatropha curcas]|uniref:Uncharacterized protein n=1 Tax=Jatropha curcas TaxID=180498 RepID=A0A067JFQ4_JATCU|nr:hypothetical protein JCGZ_01930 [Jatropha curcas]